MTDALVHSEYKPAHRLAEGNNPLVTIFIPTVGRLSLIREAVQSARTQSYSPIEILIGDNASSDGTAAYVTELAAADERVARYRFSSRVPMSRSWQEGFDRAVGKYIIILSDDDLITPDCISSCVEAFAVHPGVHVVAGVQETMGTEGTPETERWKAIYLAQAGGAGKHHIDADTFNGWRPLMGACLLDREWWREIGFGTYSGMSADIDMFLRGAAKGYDAVVIRGTIAKYRIHPAMNSASAVTLHSDALRVIDHIGQSSPWLFARPAWRQVHDAAIEALVNTFVSAQRIEEARACIRSHSANLDSKVHARLKTKIWLNSSKTGQFLWNKARQVRGATRWMRAFRSGPT